MGAPQTMREALLAELLGDVDALMQRLEELQTTLPAAADNAAGKVSDAGKAATDEFAQTAAKLRRDLVADSDVLRKELQGVTKETQAAAKVVDQSARRFAIMALLMGLAGGVIGGVLAGLALANHTLG
ncbi:hypothetical protein ACEV93_18635 [Vibrio parahaemolyticus]